MMEFQNNNINMTDSSTTSRPTVPPKPKPPSNLRSTVGTQVNLVRKTLPAARNEDTNCGIGTSSPKKYVTVTSNNNVNFGEQFRHSEIHCPDRKPIRLTPNSSAKPALPPKPVSGSIASPNRSLVSPSGLTSPPTPARKDKSIAQSSTLHPAPQASIDELDALSDLSSPSPGTPFHEANREAKPKILSFPVPTKSLSPRGTSLVNPTKTPVFQFPPSKFLSSSQRTEVAKKSTSLGRNFDLVAFTKEVKKSNGSMSRVTPLDLSSCTNKSGPLPQSFGRAITFASKNTSQPPPAPPRRKRSSVSSPDPTFSPESYFPTSPKSTPVYAKIDMEKKRELRRQREGQEDEKSTSLQHLDEKESGQADSIPLIDATEEPLSVNCQSNTSQKLMSQDDRDSDSTNRSWLNKYLLSTNNNVSNDTDNSMPREFANVIASAANTGDKKHAIIDKDLSENNSFLFHHVQQEQNQEMISDVTLTEVMPQNEIMDNECKKANVNVDGHKLSDSFESEFEHKLETLTPNQLTDLAKIKNNLSKVNIEDAYQNSQLTDYTSDSLLGENNPLTDAGNILKTVDMKIQNLQTFLSRMSQTPADSMVGSLPNVESKEFHDFEPGHNDAFLVEQIVSLKFDRVGLKDNTLTSLEEANEAGKSSSNLQPHEQGSPSYRRRSWNCSDSSSTQSASPSSSSSSLRDRTGSIATTRSRDSSWIDEGEISTGALGDLDSDAPGAVSKDEICANQPGAISRRKRIASMFSSFGKGSGGSSSSNNGHGHSRPSQRKTKPQFFVDPPPSSLKIHVGHKVMSDAVISRTQPSQSSSSLTSAHFQPSQKTQLLPGLGYEDTSIIKHHVASPDHNSTFDSCGSITHEEKDETESIASSCSLYDEILMELLPKEKKIFQVAKEILTTERTFVDVLNLLTVDFPNALKEASIHPLISDNDLTFIMGGLPTLKSVNEILLSDLDERIRGWRSNPKLADIFVKKGPFLKHYSSYIRDFKAIGEYFDEVRRKYPKFDTTVRDFECSDRCQKLSLKHYMLKPVQRMPQYSLLLEQYLTKLDEDCEDYQDTVKAITIVRDVADHANEAIRLKENGDQMKRLQERLVHNNEILKADRQIIKEGSLEKVCRKGYQPRYFALMSDCLLCMMYNATTGSNRDLKLRYELPLTGMKVHATASEDRPNEFSVISTTRSFNLVARKEKEREDWLKAIGKAIHSNIKKRACTTPDMEKEFEVGKVAPVWIQDTRVTMCQACTAEFTITFRRHHCRACGKVVCGNCSGNEAPLQYQNCEAARVCDDCYKNILEEFDRGQRDSVDDAEKMKEREDIRGRFKKTTPNVSKRYKHKKSIPQRLEVNSASSSQISGYLHWREKKSWKRRWFVLSNKVLYVCMASEDVVAYKTIPILGYDVEAMTDKTYEGVDGQLVFKLTHSGQNPMIFQADSTFSVQKWVAMMKDATVLT